MNNLKAKLGFKGERGYSAYEIAVQNGFEGTEQDWLATLGTSSHLTQDVVNYTSVEGQTHFDLPSTYTSDTFVDVYVDGSRLTSDDYTISNNKVVLTTGLTEGKKVEIVEMTMSTNSLPIVTSVDSASTDDTVLSAKGSYGLKQTIDSNTNQINILNTNVGDLQTIQTALTNDINTVSTNLTNLENKVVNGGTYSTVETLTNDKWIDGKPIYRKVFNIGEVPAKTTKVINYMITDLEQVIDLRGFNDIDIDSRNFAVPINFYNIQQYHGGEFANGQYCFVKKNSQEIEFYSTWVVHDLVVIMEYTKTEGE